MGPGSLKLALAPAAWRFLSWGVRLTGDDPGEFTREGPVIFACLHRDILPAILYVRPVRPALLVSTSDDGEILIRALGEDDYEFARGQTGQEGARALVELRRKLRAGTSVGLAVDGPKEPFGRIQPGVVQLARLAEVPIVPLRAEAARGLNLDTWDRTLVPAPLAPVRIVAGAPLRIAADAAGPELDRALRQLGAFFGVAPDEGETT